jgi:DNA sulfur modification protein DndD
VKLTKLSMYNFRQFYGENILEFAVEEEKNITLIHGENGVGKTTILNAILWCLFEKLTADFEGKNELVNKVAQAEGSKSCRVEVEFEHEEKRYHVQRRLATSQSQFRVHQVLDDGNYEPLKSGRAFINSVLPEDMAEYFFFHGEGITSISESASGAKFRRAIRSILGFTFAEKAIEDLKWVQVAVGKELSKSEKAGKAMTRDLNALNSLRQVNLNAEKDIEKYEDQYREHTREYDNFVKLINESGHEKAKELQTELTKFLGDKKRKDKELQQVNDERMRLIEKYGYVLFGHDLASKTIDFIDEEQLRGRIPAPYDEVLVQDCIKDGACICGRELEEGTKPYDHILSLLQTANTAVISQRLTKARAVGEKIKGQAQEFLLQVRSTETRLKNLHSDIGLLEDEIKFRDEQQKSIGEDAGEDAVKAFVASKHEVGRKRDDAHTAKRQREATLKNNNIQIRMLERSTIIRGARDEKTTQMQNRSEVLSEMIARCQQRLSDFEQTARVTMATSVNSILENFSRKDYSIRVTEGFEFHLSDKNGELVRKSKGENLLLNLAFVSGLIEQAQKRANASGDFLISGATAPFVIDAPFGELDETYKQTTASFLPERSEQLVLLLSSSHWKGTVDTAIRSKIGKEYVLVSQRQDSRGNKPEDIIKIGRKKFQQSLYEQERDQTTVEVV